jgi:hypothetical protein
MTMFVAHYVAYFFGGFFLANAVPHFVAGTMGEPFQSPFAKPSGIGLSSSKVNALWGALNIAIGYALICQVGTFDLKDIGHVAVTLVGATLSALFLSHHFGKLHGGDLRS